MLSWARFRAWFTDNHLQMLLSMRQSRWGDMAVVSAYSILGYRESGANNRGPDIDVLRRGRKLRPWQSGAWCATAMSYVIEEAYASTRGYSRWDWAPKTIQRQCRVKRTPGALRLANRIAAAGTLVTEPEPGDFALWTRKGGHHIGIVVRVEPDSYYTIEGNKGRFNRKTGKGSVVREYRHEYGEPNLKFFARLP